MAAVDPAAAAVPAVPIAYLVGTFPTAQLVATAHGHDPTREGSHNPGASNVYRLAGARAGAEVFAGDFVKGLFAAGLGGLLGGRPVALACGVAAVLGHMFPVTRGWRGGRGVATAGGMSLALWPGPAAIAALSWLLIARITKKASIASLVIAVLVPATVALGRRPGWEIVGVSGVALLVVARHADNLRRLWRGDEASLRSGP